MTSDSDPRPRERNRPYDIVIWGATGFTGRLVAEHLLRTRADGDLRLALGGRNLDKLKEIRAGLAEVDPAAADLPLEVADSFDADSLDALAAKTTVVCTTVGPYAKYGAALVGACVRNQTDYCDLTGEVPFIRKMIDAHHEQAHENGTRIVNCCGFDSIPSDLGTLMMQRAMQQRHGAPASVVKLGVTSTKGGFSGGTVASMLELMDAMKVEPALRKLMVDPYSLDPADGSRGPDGPDRQTVFFDDDLNGWTAPFVMAGINTRIVRRSNALMGYEYGRDFSYQEVMTFKPTFKGRMTATSVAVGLGAFLAGVAFGPSRKLLQRFMLPAPGEGPSKEEREAGSFKMRLFARGDADGKAVELRGKVEGFKDPGYGGTAIMLGEAARCLAVDPLSSEGGLTTPAVAMGEALLERLRGAGMVFEVES